MTTTLPADFPPGLKAFIDAVSADEKLQAVFDALFADPDSEAGKAAIIAKAAEIGAPITALDIDTLAQTPEPGAAALSDDALDGVGGGIRISSWSGRPLKTTSRP
jgi:hypothetical protein